MTHWIKIQKGYKTCTIHFYRNDIVSEAIKEAKCLNIPTYETKVTNKIYKQTSFQDVIDIEFYTPVAEVLAEVYHSQKNKVHKKDKI